VERLIELGADLNRPDKRYMTALHHAVYRADKGADASFEMETLLIRNGANVNAVDKYGRTPLHYAFMVPNN